MRRLEGSWKAARVLLNVIHFVLVMGAAAQQTANRAKEQAVEHLSAGRYAEAIRLLDGYVSQDSLDAEGYYLRGICRERRSEFERAVNDYRKASTLTPDNREILASLDRAESGWHLLLAEEIDGYKRERALNEKDHSYNVKIAKCYADWGRFADAELWYERYFAASAGSESEILQYVQALVNDNKLAKADDVLHTALGKFPSNQALLVQRGNVLLWLGKHDAAVRVFTLALEKDPSNWSVRKGLAESKKARPKWEPRRREEDDATLPADPPAVAFYQKLLTIRPTDHDSRFKLIEELAKVQRFREASEHLDTLAMVFTRSERVRASRDMVKALRDSVYDERIAEGRTKLLKDPLDKNAVLQLADDYNEKHLYDSTFSVLEEYKQRIAPNEDRDIDLAYARYAAWCNEFPRAVDRLDTLLRKDPENLEYQLLRGQVSVWSEKDLENAEKYLNNVHRKRPESTAALLPLAYLYVLKLDLVAARRCVQEAQRLDPSDPEVQETAAYYARSLKVETSRQMFALLTKARQEVASGDCLSAITHYDQYLASAVDPAPSILLECADARSSVRDFKGAIAMCDKVLEPTLGFTVSLRKAKYLLWGGDSLHALADLSKLVAERPDHFETKMYLGDALFRTGKIVDAAQIYHDLGTSSADSSQNAMIQTRLAMVAQRMQPSKGINFPNYAAFAPSMTYFYDNTSLQFMDIQGKAELGSFDMFSLGASVGTTKVQSSISNRSFMTVKGRALVQVLEGLSLDGGCGFVSTHSEPQRVAADVTMRYHDGGNVVLTASYQGTDASHLLYSPYLADSRLYAHQFLSSLSYAPMLSVTISARLEFLSVSDGNLGSSLFLSFGKKAYGKLFVGYEYTYLNYTRQAAAVSIGGAPTPLYYSPQNAQTHSIVLRWNFREEKEEEISMGGRVGYIPLFDALLREVQFRAGLKIGSLFVIAGSFALGSTYRYTSQYNYGSCSLSGYYSFH